MIKNMEANELMIGDWVYVRDRRRKKIAACNDAS